MMRVMDYVLQPVTPLSTGNSSNSSPMAPPVSFQAHGPGSEVGDEDGWANMTEVTLSAELIAYHVLPYIRKPL